MMADGRCQADISQSQQLPSVAGRARPDRRQQFAGTERLDDESVRATRDAGVDRGSVVARSDHRYPRGRQARLQVDKQLKAASAWQATRALECGPAQGVGHPPNTAKIASESLSIA